MCLAGLNQNTGTPSIKGKPAVIKPKTELMWANLEKIANFFGFRHKFCYQAWFFTKLASTTQHFFSYLDGRCETIRV
jgi:hypothetical protein